MKQIYVIVSVCLFLSSCASLPQSVMSLDPVSTLSAPQNFEASQPQNSQIINGLMEVFEDETLETLVRQSLIHNLDIQLAARQMEEAGFTADAELGNFLPKVTGNVATNYSQGAIGKPVESYTPSLDVSWELDLWGKLRGRKDALDATALEHIETYQDTRDSIVAQVMQGWFDVVTTEKLVALEQSRLSNLEKSAENSRRNYQAGLRTPDDLSAVERDIAQTKATITTNINNRNAAIRTLQILMGDYPGGSLALDYELPALLPPILLT